MKKYAFVLHHKELTDFLEELQNLGVVDVERHEAQLDDRANRLFLQSERYVSAYKQLKLVNIDKEADIKPYSDNAEQLIIAYEELAVERDQLNAKAKKLEKDIQEALPWGNSDADMYNKIEALGYIPHFYVIFEKSYNKEWENEYPIQIVNQEKGKIYFVLLQQKEETLEFDQQEVRFPITPCADLENEHKDIQKRLDQTEHALQQMSLSKDILLVEKNNIMSEFDFQVAGLNAKRQAEGTIAIVTGWIPKPDDVKLLSFLDEKGVLYLAEESKSEDSPPILLKNNAFSRLYELITRLYSLPNYSELDLTPFFAPFFMLFFGMCFGDGGYGLLLLGVATFVKFKVKKQSVRDIATLGQWFGLATIIVCLFTGSFFGMTIGPLNIMGSKGLVEQRLGLSENYGMLFLSILIGIIQVLFAMCIKVAKIIKQQSIKYALSQIAWVTVLVCGIVYLAVGKYIGAGIYVVYALAGMALLIAFFYNSPGKNAFLNFGIGLWDTYNMASGLLGDLLSYIRLFALGFTGGVLGMVFNSLAFSIDVGFLPVNILATGLVLIIGHSLNIALNGLGAFVHPLRLTFVEFYKNAGFEGGGKSFIPFKKNKD